MAARFGRDERGRLAGGDAQHPFDEVEARDHLGDAVLDLQPRIHLQEIERARLHIIDELDRARGAIADRLAEPHRRLAERAPLRVAQAGRGRFLDHFLVAPLRGAVAFAERDHRAAAVAEELHLDVARDLDELLQVDAVVLEVVAPETAHGLEFLPQLLCRAAELHADAAAARGALEHDWQAHTLRFRDGLVRAREQAGAGEQRHAAIARDFPRRVLQPEAADLIRRRSGERDARALARLGEGRVFAQKSVAGMHRLRAGLLRDFEDARGVQVALACRRRADAHSLIRERDVHRVAVGLGIDRDRSDAQPAERADDAAGDFAAIGYQDFSEHGGWFRGAHASRVLVSASRRNELCGASFRQRLSPGLRCGAATSTKGAPTSQPRATPWVAVVFWNEP